MKTKIDSKNLTQFVGQSVSLYCQVGVMMTLTGTLKAGYGFCQWGLDLGNGNVVGFSFGQFEVIDGICFIQIS